MLKKLLHSREITAFAFIVLMFAGVGLINKNFLSAANIWLCLNSSVVYTVVAVGIALVIITGEIDVSADIVRASSAVDIT